MPWRWVGLELVRDAGTIRELSGLRSGNKTHSSGDLATAFCGIPQQVQDTGSTSANGDIIMHNDIDIDRALKNDKSRNPDPITGAPGSHPVGTGVGAAIGGAAAAGALAGTTAGPVGTIAGAAVGAVVGALVGKGVAEKVDPTREAAYWKENHSRQAYANGRSYDEFGSAYRVGYEGYGEYGANGKTYDETEAELRRRYEKENAKLAWSDARPAVRSAWEKFDKGNAPESNVDSYGNRRSR